MANNTSEIAFLLGAGASVDAGLPTAIGLTEKVEERIISNYSSELLDALRFIAGAIQFGKACRGEKISGQINIEELLTASTFLASRDLSPVYPFVANWHEKIAKLQSAWLNTGISPESDCFKFLADLSKTGLREWLAIESPEKLKYFRSLQDFSNSGFTLRIFTLNYDECLERALTDIAWGVNQAWTSGFSEEGWKPDLLEKNDFKAYIYKLHGSLDWTNDAKLGLCSVQWPPTIDSEGIAEDFNPLIIFGTNNKLQSIDPFLTLLSHFQKVLNRCSIVIIIGYSFGDNHINDMIFEAMQRDSQMRCIVGTYKTPVSDLIPSDFQRFKDRFIEVKGSARTMLEDNILLNEAKNIAQELKEEAPF